jgi:sterol desaturase/sphingolipid hydroxylase (fatty acid hydroxylase superfamily)
MESESGVHVGIAMRLRRIVPAVGSLVNDISESRANYWASYAVDLSCPLLFAYLGLRRPVWWPAAVVTFLAGLILFTFVEYAIHRWLLHNPNSALSHLHAVHHNFPEKPSAFLFPASIVILVPVWFLLTWLHFPAASFFLCGFSGGYFYFGMLHHFEHTTRINQIPFRWLQTRWAAHSVHHRIDQSNFGVMTSFWDYVFGTQQRQQKRKSVSS